MKVTTKGKSAARGLNEGKTLGATEFKAHCLELLDEVHRTRVPLTITKRGKAVAQVVPVQTTERKLFGAGKGLVLYMGDIISPIDVKWEAEG